MFGFEHFYIPGTFTVTVPRINLHAGPQTLTNLPRYVTHIGVQSRCKKRSSRTQKVNSYTHIGQVVKRPYRLQVISYTKSQLIYETQKSNLVLAILHFCDLKQNSRIVELSICVK